MEKNKYDDYYDDYSKNQEDPSVWLAFILGGVIITLLITFFKISTL